MGQGVIPFDAAAAWYAPGASMAILREADHSLLQQQADSGLHKHLPLGSSMYWQSLRNMPLPY